MIAAGVLCAAVVFLLYNHFAPPSIYEIFEQKRGYVMHDRQQVELALTVPKSQLPDSIYQAEGCTFEKGEVPAYRSDTTTIELYKAMPANEDDDLLYLIFDFSYELPDSGSFLAPYCHDDDIEGGMGSSFNLSSRDMRDAEGSFPNALAVRGQGPGAQVAFYASRDAVQSAQGEIQIDMVCSEIFYERAR